MIYSLTAEAWVPGSLRGKAEIEFLVNLPPYGGDCSVTPKSGKALSLMI